MNIQWNAEGYTNDFHFVHEYGGDVLSLLDLQKGQTVIDLGCGNGALTQKLAGLGATAIGIDASEELLAVAREQYPELQFIRADATSFTVQNKVDAVFSNAVLHWIEAEKQLELLRHVAAALKGGGVFVFEFGGSGCTALIHGALRDSFSRRGLHYRMPFYFPTIGQYSPLLEQVGFRVEYAVLFDRPTKLKGENGLSDWIVMFLKTPFLDIGGAVKQEIIVETVEELKPVLYKDGCWYADYVRIRMKAVLQNPGSP